MEAPPKLSAKIVVLLQEIIIRGMTIWDQIIESVWNNSTHDGRSLLSAENRPAVKSYNDPTLPLP
jgi:hypothetical protein